MKSDFSNICLKSSRSAKRSFYLCSTNAARAINDSLYRAELHQGAREAARKTRAAFEAAAARKTLMRL